MKLYKQDKNLGVKVFYDEDNILIEKIRKNANLSFTYSNPDYDWVIIEEEKTKLPRRENENLIISKYEKPELVVGDSEYEKECKIQIPRSTEKIERIEIWEENNEADIIDNIKENERIQTKQNEVIISNIIKGITYTVAIILKEKRIHIDNINTKWHQNLNIDLDRYLKDNVITIRVPEKAKNGYLTLKDKTIELDGREEYKIRYESDEIEVPMKKIKEKESIYARENIILEADGYAPIIKEIENKKTIEIKEKELKELSEIEIKSNYPNISDISKIDIVIPSDFDSIDTYLYRNDKYKKSYFNQEENKIKKCIPKEKVEIRIKSEYIRTSQGKKIEIKPNQKKEIKFNIPNKEERTEILLYIESNKDEDFIVSYNKKKSVHHKSGKEQKYYINSRKNTIKIKNIDMEIISEISLDEYYSTPNIYFEKS